MKRALKQSALSQADVAINGVRSWIKGAYSVCWQTACARALRFLGGQLAGASTAQHSVVFLVGHTVSFLALHSWFLESLVPGRSVWLHSEALLWSWIALDVFICSATMKVGKCDAAWSAGPCNCVYFFRCQYASPHTAEHPVFCGIQHRFLLSRFGPRYRTRNVLQPDCRNARFRKHVLPSE